MNISSEGIVLFLPKHTGLDFGMVYRRLRVIVLLAWKPTHVEANLYQYKVFSQNAFWSELVFVYQWLCIISYWQDGVVEIGGGVLNNAVPHEITHWGQSKISDNFADDTFKCIFNENFIISIKISLKFVPKGPWRQPCDKLLSELLISSLTYICVTRPQWVKYHSPTTCGVTQTHCERIRMH